MDDLFLLGTGLLAEELFAVATHCGVPVAAFVENLARERAGTDLCGRPVIWVDDLPAGAACVCALSTTKRRRFIDQVAPRARFVNLIHSSCIVLPGSSLGAGSICSVGVIVASNTTIGRHVFINRGARIGHHTVIADFVTIQPGANIAGAVAIGEESYVGMGAVILERRKIGNGATIAAGAVVTIDVPDSTLVAGNPAVIKKRDIPAR